MKYLVCLLLFLSACDSSSGGGAPSAAAYRDLINVWLPKTGTGYELDFSGSIYGNTGMRLFPNWLFQNRCTCTIKLIGDDKVGALEFTACAYDAGTGTGVDPGCAAITGLFYYQNVGAVLTIGTQSTAVEYQRCYQSTCAN